MSQQKLTLPITGMHCKSCEILLEEKISKVAGVKKVSVHHKKSSADVYYETQKPDAAALAQAVRDAGYDVGIATKGPFFSQNTNDYVELLFAGAALAAIYLMLAGTGVLDTNIEFGSSPSMSAVILIGLVAGISTCMALVGGLVLGISARHAELHPEATLAQKFRPHLFFNLGRIVSYAVLGGVIGFAGSFLQLSSNITGLFVAAAGVLMFFIGVRLIEVIPGLSRVSLLLPKSISTRLLRNHETKEYSHTGAALTGAVTFFLPCGFTQAMQIYAISTGSFTQGALIMSLFALGTMPGLLGIGGLTSLVKGVFARYFFKFVGIVVIALGIFNLQSGLTLAGIALPQWGSGKSGVVSEKNAPAEREIVDGKQIVRMDQVAGGYKPNVLTVKKGIPVKWVITSKNQYTCAAFINMPSMNIQQPLTAGENVIEFTPTKTGTLKFTCSMGMYSGVFNVVD